ncbi:hypothetical protein ABEB36_013948 [Hypothenemus hampei]
MSKRQKFNLSDYVSYDQNTDKSACLFEKCGKTVSGKRPANIGRHYLTVHKTNIQNVIQENDSDSNDIEECETVIQVYSNTTDNGANVIKCTKLLQEIQEQELLGNVHSQNAEQEDEEEELIHIEIE